MFQDYWELPHSYELSISLVSISLLILLGVFTIRRTDSTKKNQGLFLLYGAASFGIIKGYLLLLSQYTALFNSLTQWDFIPYRYFTGFSEQRSLVFFAFPMWAMLRHLAWRFKINLKHKDQYLMLLTVIPYVLPQIGCDLYFHFSHPVRHLIDHLLISL